MKEEIPPEIVVAVEWWASRAGSRINRMDNMGDTSRTLQDGMAGMLAIINQVGNSTPKDDQLEQFKICLREQLLERWKNDNAYIYLGVDYGPDPILSKAMGAGGLQTTLPWKTGMWIQKNKVSVSEGYGADDNIIYSQK